MNYSAQYLTDNERQALQTAYTQHGRDANFWQVYQQLERIARERTGDSRVKVANEMARAAAGLGATSHPLFV